MDPRPSTLTDYLLKHLRKYDRGWFARTVRKTPNTSSIHLPMTTLLGVYNSIKINKNMYTYI